MSDPQTTNPDDTNPPSEQPPREHDTASGGAPEKPDDPIEEAPDVELDGTGPDGMPVDNPSS